MKDYPVTTYQAKPYIEDAIRYVALHLAARLLFSIWWKTVSTLWKLRWLHFRYVLFYSWRKEGKQ